MELLATSTTWPWLSLTLWVLVGGLSLALIWAARSRWAKERPLHRCVLWSLVAHLVLIGIAATVRFVTQVPGDGVEKPLRIKIVAAAAPQAVPNKSPEDQPSLPSPPVKKTSPAEESQSEESKSTAKALPEPPSLLPEPSPEPTSPPIPVPPPTATDSAKLAKATPAAPPSPAANPTETIPASLAPVSTPAAPTTPDITPIPVSPTAMTAKVANIDPVAPLVPAPLAARLQPDRLATAIEQGGTPQTEEAVERALEWLAMAQSEDGRWDASRWHAGHERAVLGHNRGGAGGQADTGITALGLLTFLGAGHTHQQGQYQQTVTAGLNYLLREQSSEGHLYGNASLYARTYCHSMATFALAEALALTHDDRLRPAVTRATNFLRTSQDPTTGGWRYRPGDRGDLSQMGWIVMALRSAELAGIPVPDSTWQRIEHFLGLVTRGRHGGLAAYQPTSGVSRAMTAEALYCRQVLGKPLTALALGETLEALAAEPPGVGPDNLYYWYYATLALHHARHDGPAARHTWEGWNERLQQTLLASQVADGSNRGSWSPNTVWGGYGGRVYSTAMATMCLEVYYRYQAAPQGQGIEAPWIATRPRTPMTR